MAKNSTSCPISKVAQLLSDSWTMLILYQLNQGPKHFCELERSLDGISTRTLSLKLRKLIDDELVLKSDEGTYSSTKKARGLKYIEDAMRRYEREYL